MALSNVFREPRREITEQLVGTIIVGAFSLVDYKFAAWSLIGYVPRGDEAPYGVMFAFAMFVGALICPLAFALLTIVHFVGDKVCGWLDQRGLRLRPKERY
jgi:hypothetical protein